MRILWFTNTASNYKSNNKYNGGGWISALENELKKQENIELGICFFYNEEQKIKQKNITYYPIKQSKKFFSFIPSSKYTDKENNTLIKKFLNVISDFKPDIIHIFGSEMQFGLIAKYTKTPIVLHIQGILTPCLNAYLPPFVSWLTFYFKSSNPLLILKGIKERINWTNNSNREQEIIKNIYNYIGRTTWDYRVIKTLNPHCRYYYGSEILREEFYKPEPRTLPQQLIIVSTISSPLYKGFDLILKTASILKNNYKQTFKWIVFGNINPSFIERTVGIYHNDVNIILRGIATANEIKKMILTSTVFMHPSYIDNSPNSICEAQILGCSVIATNVGGIPTLIKDQETGFLVPANDPYQTAYLINELFRDKNKNITIGKNAQKVANKRHDKNNIVIELVSIYKNIISLNNK